MLTSSSAGPARRLLLVALPGLVVAAVAVAVLLWSGRDVGPPALTVPEGGATPAAIGDVSSVYLRIDDDGGSDRLLSASAPVAAAVTLHSTAATDEAGGVMTGLTSMSVPSKGTLWLLPGRDHLMLHHVFEPLEPGDVVVVTLQFERSGTISVQVPVRTLVELAEFGSSA